ncbi:hypothetical protein ACLB2K_066297 [Fragaria x ananassa]
MCVHVFGRKTLNVGLNVEKACARLSIALGIDTILKKYSSTVATIFTGIASAVLFGHTLTMNFVLGISIVFISMHQFFSPISKAKDDEKHGKLELVDVHDDHRLVTVWDLTKGSRFCPPKVVGLLKLRCQNHDKQHRVHMNFRPRRLEIPANPAPGLPLPEAPGGRLQEAPEHHALGHHRRRGSAGGSRS